MSEQQPEQFALEVLRIVHPIKDPDKLQQLFSSLFFCLVERPGLDADKYLKFIQDVIAKKGWA
jgi:hypothetical protein